MNSNDEPKQLQDESIKWIFIFCQYAEDVISDQWNKKLY